MSDSFVLIDKHNLDVELGITRIYPTDDVVVLVAEGLDSINTRRIFQSRWGIILKDDIETKAYGGIPKTSVFLIDDDSLRKLINDTRIRKAETFKDAKEFLRTKSLIAQARPPV